MQIKLNGIQRFKIQDMVTAHTGAQRMVFADSLKWRALTKAIHFTEAELNSLLFTQAPDRTVVTGLDKIEPREFEVNVTSANLLKTLLETFPGVTDKDIDWMEPIMEQIEAK